MKVLVKSELKKYEKLNNLSIEASSPSSAKHYIVKKYSNKFSEYELYKAFNSNKIRLYMI